jgi:hypothetical protein
MNRIRTCLACVFGLLAVSCDAPITIPAAVSAVDLRSLPGVYAGGFPCANCPGIEVRLWIREDGVFFLRQDYLGELSSPIDRVHALGRWRWNAAEARLVLEGRGPDRKFQYTGNGRLELETLSAAEHVLTRQAESAQFADLAMFDGELLTASEPSTFRECVTGLSFAVHGNAGDRDLRRQHRRLSAPDVAALVVVQGRLDYTGPAATLDAVLVVEQLLSIKPSAFCPARL